MMSLAKTILTAAVLFPGLAFAQADFPAWMDEIVSAARGGSGTVIIENVSSVSTGGQTAGTGQTVVTDGDVSASSHIETRINTGNNGGTVYVKTETTQNGETKTEEYTRQVEPGDPVRVNISAEAHAGGVQSDIQAGTEPHTSSESEEGASPTEEELASALVEAKAETRIGKAFKAVPSFFKKIFGFVWGW